MKYFYEDFYYICLQWRNAWKVMSRLPKGIPKMWRKEVRGTW